MNDVEAVPSNGFNVVSTFSGCGGSCLGYRMAGFKVLWANEFVKAARDTYAINAPDTMLDARDIRSIEPEDILDAISLQKGEIDLFDGSPPCASFSTAGNVAESWGKVKSYSDTKQRVDDLFFEYARLIDGLQPKTFVAENVKGLVTGAAKGYFKQILRALKSLGYRVSVRAVDAQYLGVPQHRERLIFVGVREDLKRDPVHPPPRGEIMTLREALPYVIQYNKSGAQYVSADLGAHPTIAQSDASRSDRAQMSATGWIKVLNDEGILIKRKFTIEELKIVCGFPTDFELTGSFAQQWERLGRAVPPPMMRAVAAEIRDHILS